VKRYLLSVVLLSITNLAHAVPNVWSDFLRQGGYNVIIESKVSDKLDVGCYLDPEDPKWHMIEVTHKGKIISNKDTKQPLSFYINDSASYTPNPTSITFVDKNHWNAFIDNLITANKIEVYSNNKLIFTLNPRNGKTIKYIEGCHIL
jgi:hypothetical protein